MKKFSEVIQEDFTEALEEHVEVLLESNAADLKLSGTVLKSKEDLERFFAQLSEE